MVLQLTILDDASTTPRRRLDDASTTPRRRLDDNNMVDTMIRIMLSQGIDV
jgi:hypothetical protein